MTLWIGASETGHWSGPNINIMSPIKLIVTGAIAVIVLVGLGAYVVSHNSSNGKLKGVTYDVSNLVGDVYQGPLNTLIARNGFIVGPLNVSSSTIGTRGTSLAGIKTGSCTIWTPTATIAATTSAQVECQGATTGANISRISGITLDSSCTLTAASSSSSLYGGIIVGNLSASSTSGTATSGTLLARLVNLTGGTFTWSATASSSWKYTCLDPN